MDNVAADKARTATSGPVTPPPEKTGPTGKIGGREVSKPLGSFEINTYLPLRQSWGEYILRRSAKRFEVTLTAYKVAGVTDETIARQYYNAAAVATVEVDGVRRTGFKIDSDRMKGLVQRCRESEAEVYDDFDKKPEGSDRKLKLNRVSVETVRRVSLLAWLIGKKSDEKKAFDVNVKGVTTWKEFKVRVRTAAGQDAAMPDDKKLKEDFKDLESRRDDFVRGKDFAFDETPGHEVRTTIRVPEEQTQKRAARLKAQKAKIETLEDENKKLEEQLVQLVAQAKEKGVELDLKPKTGGGEKTPSEPEGGLSLEKGDLEEGSKEKANDGSGPAKAAVGTKEPAQDDLDEAKEKKEKRGILPRLPRLRWARKKAVKEIASQPANNSKKPDSKKPDEAARVLKVAA